MGMFNPLSLANRVFNTVNNDVVKPAQRFDQQHVLAPAVKAWQTLIPGSGYNQAKPYVSAAENQYHVTPQFRAIINGGNPALSNQVGQNKSLRIGNAAAQEDSNNYVNQIQLTPGYGVTPAAVIHEALHREWQLKPADRAKFIQAYNSGANPNLRSYLIKRTSGYKDVASGGPRQFMDLNLANPTIQNEVHSYIPEYYQQNPKVALDGPLADYYSQFFPANFPQQNQQSQQIAGNIEQMLGHGNPNAQLRTQAPLSAALRRLGTHR